MNTTSYLLGYVAPTWASLVAGSFVLVTLVLSIYLLFEHLSAYKNPEEQKFLIGVILMVPCYAIESLVSLVNPSISVYCEILRDCYESFAMYCFGRYLVACLGGEERTIEFMEREGRASSKTPLLEHSSEKGTVKHPFPMNYFLKPWRLGQWFYQIIKIGIVQYMMIKSLSAILAVILEAFSVYCEGEFKWGCGYPYIAVVLNFSQSWALYCLVQFYTATKDELVHIKPLAKFLAFKSIVFLTWWQVLGDYASADCPLDPDEVRDSERPTKLRLAQPDIEVRSGMTIRESVRDVVLGGGGHIVNDVKFTVTQAVEPMEKGITKFGEKLHKISQNIKRHDKDRRRTKDDSCIATSSPARKVIRGIDDPLLNGSISDSGFSRAKKHRRKSGYTSAESGGESSSDQSYGGYQIRGGRWVTKD
ncbi:protein LAZ1-like isoform X4 [Carya illinoinensis]|uniref:protein LAZ1-like isoform X4 n=1 Tax=Carya illinoinensis TaxID=32201 RepID=UPI001C7208F5|nr:protein LAZ1-like isoform X4 [Carya illinoinensis]